MNLSSGFVDDRYLEVLIIPQTVVAEVLRNPPAVADRLGIRVELDADTVPHRNAVSHVEKKLLHRQRSNVRGR